MSTLVVTRLLPCIGRLLNFEPWHGNLLEKFPKIDFSTLNPLIFTSRRLT